VLVLLLLIAAVALSLWRPWEAWGQAGAAPAESQTPRPSATASGPEESASPTPTPQQTPAEESPSPSPDPSPDPSATLAVCTSGDISVSAVTDKESYGAGEKPQLSISIVNNGDTECVMNVGTAAQAFTIASGTDTWWRSTDCQKKPSDQMVTLEPGKTVKSVEPLIWDRTRSSVDTCDGDRPTARGDGYYNLTVTIGGIESEPRQFYLR
jgi:hypothetical protein